MKSEESRSGMSLMPSRRTNNEEGLKMKQAKLPVVLGAAMAAIGLSACTVTDVQPSPSLSRDASWVLLPVVNYSEAPQAGQRAEVMLGTLLRKRGVQQLDHYPEAEDKGGLPDLNDGARLTQARNWAKTQSYRYGVQGAVSEWQYKTGLDGEPAVGLSVQVVDMSTGQVVWTASGADSGWGYSSVSGTAQSLLGKLVSGMPLN